MILTGFNAIHKSLNAKMVHFAGFEMPIQYPKGIIHEHKIVREKVGVFDVSHMGEFEVKGKDALAFVQKCTVNDASKLNPGCIQYSAMCYLDGGIVDDLLVYCINSEYYYLVVNGANVDKDFAWLESNKERFDIDFTNISNEINLLAVQGPKAIETLQKLTEVNLSEIVYYNFVQDKLAGLDMIISRTGYTGEVGFEIYFRGDVAVAEEIWNKIFKAGEEFGIEAVGLGCRDTLRLEKGYALYGNDIDQNTNTIEAGLGWITKLDKGTFNASDVLAKIKTENPHRRLVGFVVNAERFIARQGYKIYDGDKEIGFVTSGNLSPSLNFPVGMGYVDWNYRNVGTKIEISARGQKFEAEVKKMPLL
jgi:aminomethyltransferase